MKIVKRLYENIVSEQAFTPGSATAGFYKVGVVITNALQQ